MKKRLCLLACVLLVAFMVTGCGPKVVAVVNGENITADDIKQVALLYGYDLEKEENKEQRAYLERQVLESLIELKVILQDAKERNIAVSDDEIEAELKKIKEQFQNEQEFNELLKERKLTEKDVRTHLFYNLTTNKLFDEVTKDITTTTKDPKAYYEEFRSEFYQPEKVKTRNIVVENEEEAKDIIKRLAQGEDFAKLAVELSIDPSAKENGGLIDYFDNTAMLVEEFKEAAFALKVGEYTKTPVKTIYGYHVIKVEDKIAAKTLTFEEVEKELTDRFIMEAKNEKIVEYMDGLMEKAKIERKLPEETPASAGEGEDGAAVPEGAGQEQQK